MFWDRDVTWIATPENAVRDGASHLVVGRAITQADDPVKAAREVRANAALADEPTDS